METDHPKSQRVKQAVRDSHADCLGVRERRNVDGDERCILLEYRNS